MPWKYLLPILIIPNLVLITFILMRTTTTINTSPPIVLKGLLVDNQEIKDFNSWLIKQTQIDKSKE